MNPRGIFLILVLLAAVGVLGSVIFRVLVPHRAAAPTSSTPVLAGRAGDIKVILTIEPARPGRNRVSVKASGAAVAIRLVTLDSDANPQTLPLVSRGEGRFTAERAELAAGWSEFEIIPQLPGRANASTMFPLLIGPPPSPKSDPEAEQLFHDARAMVSEMRSWREIEQLTDGAGALVITHTDLLPPDRLRYIARSELPWTIDVTEVIIVGADRYERRNDGAWNRTLLRQPLVPEGYGVYMRSAERITGGRRGTCGDEPCRAVLWTQSGGSPAFAGWIGLRSHRMHRIYLRSPSHYMTLWPVDFNVPVTIAPPK